MRRGKQVLTENLKLRDIANAGIAAFCFAETGGYKMIKKEKKNQEKKCDFRKKFLLLQLHLLLPLQSFRGAAVHETSVTF